VSGGDTITFTLNFEKDQNAGIEFLTWTINGANVAPKSPEYPYALMPGDILGVHFKQWVDGCEGYSVTLSETSLLNLNWTRYDGALQPRVLLHVVNDWCSVNKTPTPLQKLSQVPSINDQTAQLGDSINILENHSTTVDVETSWQLVKGLDYTKSINWLGITCIQGGIPCVLFELLPQVPGDFLFTLVASAEVKVAGDVNSENDKATSPPLYIFVPCPG
jgi:hypothetical protein